MNECEKQLSRLLKTDAVAERIDAVSGVGILTASAFLAAVGQPECFNNGRILSAWLGMTPRENSSGNKRQLGSISRQGNPYVRICWVVWRRERRFNRNFALSLQAG